MAIRATPHVAGCDADDFPFADEKLVAAAAEFISTPSASARAPSQRVIAPGAEPRRLPWLPISFGIAELGKRTAALGQKKDIIGRDLGRERAFRIERQSGPQPVQPIRSTTAPERMRAPTVELFPTTDDDEVLELQRTPVGCRRLFLSRRARRESLRRTRSIWTNRIVSHRPLRRHGPCSGNSLALNNFLAAGPMTMWLGA